MNSWIYIFSQFTPEALLFEALILFLVCCAYTAFWILRKRRYGVLDPQTRLPAEPLKIYLSQLIAHADQLRGQLFGVEFTNDLIHPLSSGLSLGGLPTLPDDVPLAKKLVEAENKLLEQVKALETIKTEKAQIEKELTDVRAGNPASASSSNPNADPNATPNSASNHPSGGVDVLVLDTLNGKIRELEAKLAEYSVIEDDLANLKQLQQENALLKSTLSGKGIALPVGSQKNAPTTSAPEPETEESEPESESEAETEEETESEAETEEESETETEEEVEAETESEPEAEAEPEEEATEQEPEQEESEDSDPPADEATEETENEEPATDEESTQDPTPEPDSETNPKTESKVEESLATAPESDILSNPVPAKRPKTLTDNSEIDLVAEFEKMLKE